MVFGFWVGEFELELQFESFQFIVLIQLGGVRSLPRSRVLSTRYLELVELPRECVLREYGLRSSVQGIEVVGILGLVERDYRRGLDGTMLQMPATKSVPTRASFPRVCIVRGDRREITGHVNASCSIRHQYHYINIITGASAGSTHSPMVMAFDQPDWFDTLLFLMFLVFRECLDDDERTGEGEMCNMCEQCDSSLRLQCGTEWGWMLVIAGRGPRT